MERSARFIPASRRTHISAQVSQRAKQCRDMADERHPSSDPNVMLRRNIAEVRRRLWVGCDFAPGPNRQVDTVTPSVMKKHSRKSAVTHSHGSALPLIGDGLQRLGPLRHAKENGATDAQAPVNLN